MGKERLFIMFVRISSVYLWSCQSFSDTLLNKNTHIFKRCHADMIKIVLMSMILGSCLRSVPMPSSWVPHFSSSRCRVLGLMLRSGFIWNWVFWRVMNEDSFSFFSLQLSCLFNIIYGLHCFYFPFVFWIFCETSGPGIQFLFHWSAHWFLFLS